jgi:ATP-dependent Clp protease ATP-binding subunit ClpA
VFELFTSLAKRAIVVSQNEAMALGHDFIGTEHLLLGLAGVPQSTAGSVLREHGVTPGPARAETVRLLDAMGVRGTAWQDAAEALATIGIDVAEIRRRADESFGPGQFLYPRPPYTNRAKTVLEGSVRESRDRGDDSVGTEHMLLAMIAEGSGVGVQVLASLNVDPAVLRTALLARLPSTAS